jgi:O-antigen ligase
MRKQKLSHFLELNVVALSAILPFIVPFSPGRNVVAQGLLILLIGFFAWALVYLNQNALSIKNSKLKWVIAIYIAACGLSLIFNPHKGYDLLGSPYIRLGSLGLVACLGLGLSARSLSLRKLIAGLYALTVLIAITALPYSAFRLHNLARLGGVFDQADILAVFTGVGLLLGLQVYKDFTRYRKYIIFTQALLLIVLVLSGTRSILLILLILTPIWLHFNFKNLKTSQWLTYLVVVVLAFAALSVFYHGRLNNADYAGQSISYRYDLQKSGARAVKEKPIFGYGPGNLADGLSCKKLEAKPLLKTCNSGYFFNSSHNIFLDRFIGLGLIGGAVYLVMVILLLKSAFSIGHHSVLAYASLLVVIYYITNVTSVCLEALFMILLFSAERT